MKTCIIHYIDSCCTFYKFMSILWVFFCFNLDNDLAFGCAPKCSFPRLFKGVTMFSFIRQFVSVPSFQRKNWHYMEQAALHRLKDLLSVYLYWDDDYVVMFATLFHYFIVLTLGSHTAAVPDMMPKLKCINKGRMKIFGSNL